jgi:CopG antitoxin of type II toxin-antitoxin system
MKIDGIIWLGNNMEKSKAKTLPEFNSTNELVDFFDTYDLGDYLEQMPEANFEIKIKSRKHLIALEQDVVTQVSQIAKTKKISSEALINSWLKEQLQKAS